MSAQAPYRLALIAAVLAILVGIALAFAAVMVDLSALGPADCGTACAERAAEASYRSEMIGVPGMILVAIGLLGLVVALIARSRARRRGRQVA